MTITTDNGLNQRIVSQFMLVIEVYQSKNSLPKHGRKRMFHLSGLPNIKSTQIFSGPPGQPEFAVEFFDKKQSAIAADITAVEIEFNFSAFMNELKERKKAPPNGIGRKGGAKRSMIPPVDDSDANKEPLSELPCLRRLKKHQTFQFAKLDKRNQIFINNMHYLLLKMPGMENPPRHCLSMDENHTHLINFVPI